MSYTSLSSEIENKPTSVPSGGHHLLETHSYDGQLRALAEKINAGTKYIPSVKLTAFNDLKRTIYNYPDPSNSYKLKAIQAVNLIIFNMNNASNIDFTNSVRADDLLIVLYFKVKESPEFIGTLIEQLHDIVASGQCPQGRCTRLLQLVKCFIDK